jgi:hypothetical protein
MLYRKGRVLGGNHQVIGREIEVIAVEIALQNAFEPLLTDGNLDPFGLSLTLKGAHQTGEKAFGTEEPLRVVDGGSDDRDSHAVGHWLTDFVGAERRTLLD